MDIRLVSLLICCIAHICGSRAQFPFQGPVLYDPYASFFGSNELNPFASNDLQYAIRHNLANRPHRHTIHKEHIHPHRHEERHAERHERHRHRPHARQSDGENDQNDRPNREQIDKERDSNKKLYESEPSKWRKYSRTVYSSEPAVKRVAKQSSVAVPKHSSGEHNSIIRPKHQSPESQNNYRPKPVINYQNLNYRNSNSFRDAVPKKSINSQSNRREPDKRKDETEDDPTTLDIDMNGEEDEEDDDHHHYRHDHPRHNNNNGKKVQYAPPPSEFTTIRPNYRVRERTIVADNSKYKRPALYEIEAPKNLDRGRPHGNAYVQKIPVPQKTLMEIAELSGPPKTSPTRRPHPFEGFHTHHRHKPETEIITNNLGADMTRQVGASMSVGPEHRKIQQKGKVFDEPLTDNQRQPNADRFGKSYTEKPFRPNDRNPFNSKRRENELMNDNSEERSDDDDDVEDDTKSENPDIFVNQNKRPEFKYFTEESSQSPPVTQEQQQANWDDESDGEWTPNGGIPGEPGKDYPLLGDVGYGTDRSEFSCRGRPIGFYADVSQKCQVYHQCSPQGGQRFICPNGTLFSQESLVCEWWYNVLCENSEKLYDKNVELYDNQKQNDGLSNDQKSDNDRDTEYSKAWNYRNPNDNQNNNDNYGTHHRHKHHHSHHNHRPHGHYAGNEYEANSNRQELMSKAPASAALSAPAPTTKSAAEIDIDLSNEESRDRFVKAMANQQIVSKFNATNRTKNVVFLT